MKIAILGAGFAGLATCWHLLQYQESHDVDVTLFDPNGIGGGASGIAAGLLHPFSGLHAKYTWKGLEAMAATRQLLDIASSHLQKPVDDARGVLRPALSHSQQEDYLQCVQKHPENVKWLSSKECSRFMPEEVLWEGLYIPCGTTVYTDLYLKGLWLACQQKGAKLEKISCKKLTDFDAFDRTVVAMGSASLQLEEVRKFRLNVHKGQILALEWPQQYQPLKSAINSQGYVVMSEDGNYCVAGSTFERHYDTEAPDIGVAKREILPKVREIWAPLSDMTVIECRAGMRVTTPTRLPFCERMTDKCYLFAGLGSKGLLYHALFGQQLAHKITLNL